MLLSHMLMTCFHQWIDFREIFYRKSLFVPRNAGLSLSTPVTRPSSTSPPPLKLMAPRPCTSPTEGLHPRETLEPAVGLQSWVNFMANICKNAKRNASKCIPAVSLPKAGGSVCLSKGSTIGLRSAPEPGLYVEDRNSDTRYLDIPQQ